MDPLSQTLTILSAMITPVVLIMASSSLILSTSQRLSRSIERTRKLSEAMKVMVDKSIGTMPSGDFSIRFAQLNIASRRARLLQRAMRSLYFTIVIFIASCISIAIIYMLHTGYAWIPIALDLTGICFLFYASIILMKESRLAITAVNDEMDYMLRLFEAHFPESARKPGSTWWRKIWMLRKTVNDPRNPPGV